MQAYSKFSKLIESRNTPEINHLQFADDTLIFCGANEDHVRNVKITILRFEAVSRLKVNFFKNELFGLRSEMPVLVNLLISWGARRENC